MNRGYTRASYMELVHRARSVVPGVQLAGDFIVGFPTETDEDYALTRQVVEETRYKNSFIFKYSPRPGTVGIKRFSDDVSEDVKRFRNNDLLRLQNKISNDLNRELLGQVVDVLCGGPSGWAGTNTHGGEEPDSRVAGSGGGPVQLGPALAAGLRRKDDAASSGRLDRHGQPFVEPKKSASPQPDWVQLAGRTSFDQVVVFEGSPDLTGQIVPVRVREAYGMTIFADHIRVSDPVTLA